MNETQEAIVEFLKTKRNGAGIKETAIRCFYSYSWAYKNLQELAEAGVLGKTYVDGCAWYKFVRPM